jgi:amino-acid N-acetyltransferase
MTERQAWAHGGHRFGEKAFYLGEFRGQTLVIAVPSEAVERAADVEALAAVAADLVQNGTRLLLIWGGPTPDSRAARLAAIIERVSEAAGRQLDSRVIRVPGGGRARITMAFLKRVWGVLSSNTLAVACVSPSHGVLADFAQRLVVRLGVRKLVLVDAEGGVANEAGLVSFMDVVMLGRLLQHGEPERIGVGHRRPALEAVRAALQGGVDSVNLCDLRGVERELFTYEGAGTLFTLEDYCRVERLRVDDFPEVEKLLERGQQEGYLRVRNAKEIAEILMGGYGATIGSGHLAGVCALTIEPYRSDRAGEIVALYTITRFKGEGVGGKLLVRAIEDARQLGLRYVFACTTQDRARAFFERHGFKRANKGDVPKKKWRTRVPRHSEPTVYKLPL